MYYTGNEFENVVDEFAEMLEISKSNFSMEEYARQILLKMDEKMKNKNCELWNSLSYKGKIWVNNASKNLQSNAPILNYNPEKEFVKKERKNNVKNLQRKSKKKLSI